ncbi:rho GTPase-activating protein 24 isoform X2 [Brienomyrus brachyistius]|uniref:rho GTPase-activating protein 24 isoform X2 n=1 Tax=Brienomyrus brachyistius TaxID=42636 RepID=UPI0020B27EB8|nr:rho GTPase-activating protein 24 isoform X2 [Brienomyrus brachyistius]
MPEGTRTTGRTGVQLSHTVYRKIKRALSFRRRVFGQRLEETVVYERRYGERVVPLVVEQCVAFIRQQGLQEVGLFRQPGQATLVKELQEAFDSGEKPSFDSSTDVHTVASLLKLYLRELPEPVVPFSQYQDFLFCGKMIQADRKQGLEELRRLLQELPVVNFNLLQYICQFLYEVQSFSDCNKMSTQNLATVFGPNILRPKAEDPESIIEGTAAVQQLTAELISEHGVLFVRDGDAESRTTSGSGGFLSPGRTGKGVAEPAARSHRSYLEPSEKALPVHQLGSRSSLSPVTNELSHSPSRSTVPASQAFNLPPPGPSDPARDNTRSTFSDSSKTGATPPTAAPPPASSEVPTPMSGPDGCGPRAAPVRMQDGGRGGLRDRHRSAGAYDSTLSVYNNIDAGFAARASSAPPLDATENGSPSSSSSPWSSCEILLQDEGAGKAPGPSHSPSLRAEPEEPRVNSAASSALTETVLSSGSSDVFLPPLSPPPSSAMQFLLAGLQQQMARQKAEYEARIKSLEQRNQALQDEVAGLQASLEEQRQRHSVAEMKMRNAERARSDADRRNAALQHEMEQFFDTFGELDFEAKKTERILKSF